MLQLAEIHGSAEECLAAARLKLAEELPPACVLTVSSRPASKTASVERDDTIRVGSQEFASLYALE
jgi:hypothetical protein